MWFFFIYKEILSTFEKNAIIESLVIQVANNENIVGENRMMNCGMKATCIAYRNNTDLDIQFEVGNLQAEALLKIESLDNEDYKNVLMMRYVKNMDLNEVAKYLFISLSTAKR